MKKGIILFAIISVLGVSCSKPTTEFLSYEEQLVVDSGIIDAYLTENGLTAETTPEGLRYKITEAGNGDFPTTGTSVVVNYTGKLLNGNVFDSNNKGSFSFALGTRRVISGWDIGIALLSKGGKATLYLPSGLAYGTRGAGGDIGPNEVLIFDVELVNF